MITKTFVKPYHKKTVEIKKVKKVVWIFSVNNISVYPIKSVRIYSYKNILRVKMFSVFVL